MNIRFVVVVVVVVVIFCCFSACFECFNKVYYKITKEHNINPMNQICVLIVVIYHFC